MKQTLIITLTAVVIITACAWQAMQSGHCPEWAQKDVHALYIDLADGKMEPGTIEYFGDRIGKAVEEINDRECRDAYVAFGPNAIVKSTPEVRQWVSLNLFLASLNNN